MSGHRFEPVLPLPDAPEWGGLQHALYRWVLAHGGSALLARTAAWASLADAQADAALRLPDPGGRPPGAPTLAESDLEVLRREPMVGDGSEPRPTAFVIDAQGRFYLWRNFARERAIGRRLQARRQAPATGAAEVSDADLDLLFGAALTTADAAQRNAVRRLPARQFAVLTGGPGTGKTTTVLRILLMAQRQRQRAGLPPARIAIAATTGKAAQRLLAALRRGREALLARLDAGADPAWRDLAASLPVDQAQTIHRLLGYRAGDGRFARHADSPLEADIVVVDEASMLDLALLDALLAAMPEDAEQPTQLLLVGDADQLASVGTGSVLLDLATAMEADPALVRLRHGFRTQSPQLADLLGAVREGDGAGVDAALASAPAAWHPLADSAEVSRRLRDWAERLAEMPELRDGRADDEAGALAALDALQRRQLLCALREGDFGAGQANAVIERELRRRWRRPPAEAWYPGRAVIVVRNDYGAGLFNGDVGICLADAQGLPRVWFEAAAGDDGARRARAFAPAALPAHESAFAVTVHKSQGSEYDEVAVLLPPDPRHPVLSRQLLYTALSRARHGAALWSSREALAACLARPVLRVGGLREQLQDPPRPTSPAQSR